MSRIRTNNRISKLQRAKPLSLVESAFARAHSTGCSSKGQALQLTSGLEILRHPSLRLWMAHPSRGKVKASLPTNRLFAPPVLLLAVAIIFCVAGVNALGQT